MPELLPVAVGIIGGLAGLVVPRFMRQATDGQAIAEAEVVVVHEPGPWFEEVLDADKAEKDARRMLRGQFNMMDFLEQIRAIKKMGSLGDLIDKLPFFQDGMPEGMNVELNTARSELTSETAGGIRFYPDGGSTGGHCRR